MGALVWTQAAGEGSVSSSRSRVLLPLRWTGRELGIPGRGWDINERKTLELTSCTVVLELLLLSAHQINITESCLARCCTWHTARPPPVSTSKPTLCSWGNSFRKLERGTYLDYYYSPFLSSQVFKQSFTQFRNYRISTVNPLSLSFLSLFYWIIFTPFICHIFQSFAPMSFNYILRIVYFTLLSMRILLVLLEIWFELFEMFFNLFPAFLYWL